MKTTLTAILACGALAGSAPAALVSFIGENIAIPANFAGVYLDIETGTYATSPFVGADINFFFGGEGIGNDADDVATSPTLQFVRTATGNLDPAKNVGYLSTVGPLSEYYSTGYGGSGDPNDHLGTGPDQFEDGEEGFVGFALVDSGGTHTGYGYFHVTLTDNGAGIIHGWEFDPAGASVMTPEPSMLLLSLSALGTFLIRRRR